jgi:pantoate kinase
VRSAVRRRASAYAPGHVTGIFRPELDARDPRARGSVGAGIVLDTGVVADAQWESARYPSIAVRADVPGPLPISHTVAEHLLAARPGRLTVRLTHALPVGQGFGSSAAGATATALAVARLVGVGRDRAVATAHLAELYGGGGLGGVAAILGGGLELRQRPGIPPFGRVVHRPGPARLLVGVVGRPIATRAVLSDPSRRARLEEAAAPLDALGANPTLPAFWSASEAFTDAVGMASGSLRAVVRGLRRRGLRAAQAMFGNSFFAEAPDAGRRAAIYRWLAAGSVRALELPVAPRGARLCPPPSAPS